MRRLAGLGSMKVFAKLTLSLQASVDAAPMARQALRPFGSFLPSPKEESLELLVTELVTNAVCHPGGNGPGRLRLDALACNDTVRVEVRDRGRGFRAPRRTAPDDSGRGGWGLLMVDALADRWGVESEPSTSVWFELARDLNPSAPSPGR